jgi:hypothetical protein
MPSQTAANASGKGKQRVFDFESSEEERTQQPEPPAKDGKKKGQTGQGRKTGSQRAVEEIASSEDDINVPDSEDSAADLSSQKNDDQHQRGGGGTWMRKKVKVPEKPHFLGPKGGKAAQTGKRRKKAYQKQDEDYSE